MSSAHSNDKSSLQQVKRSILDWDIGDEGADVEAWIRALPPSPPLEQTRIDALLMKSWLNGKPWNDMAIGFESVSRPSSQDLLMARAEISGDPSGSGGVSFLSFKDDAVAHAVESAAWLAQHAARLECSPHEHVSARDGHVRELPRADMPAFVKPLDPCLAEQHKNEITAAIREVGTSIGIAEGVTFASTAAAVLGQFLDGGRSAMDLERAVFATAHGRIQSAQKSADVAQAFDAAIRILKVNGSIAGRYVPGSQAQIAMENAYRIHQYLAIDYRGDDWQAPLPRGGLSPDQKIEFRDVLVQAVHISHECAEGLLPSAIRESLMMMRLGQVYKAGYREDAIFRAFDEAFYADPLTAIDEFPQICRAICGKRDASSTPEP